MEKGRVPQSGGKRTITVYSADIDAWRPDIERILRGEAADNAVTISAERVERARRFVKAEDAHRCVGAELLLYRALERVTGRSRAPLHTERDTNGKPFLPGLPDVHFNISHSGRMILCAVDRRPVGVDVEEIRGIDRDVAATCFTGRERKRLEGREGEEWLNEFYRLWTLKESYLKALGTGLRRNPLSVEITPDDRNLQVWRTEGNHTLQVLSAPSGYAAAVCGEGEFSVANGWE